MVPSPFEIMIQACPYPLQRRGRTSLVTAWSSGWAPKAMPMTLNPAMTISIEVALETMMLPMTPNEEQEMRKMRLPQ